ncbi:BTB/POZ domain-containing protein 2-like [Topomyia yanbarensis]|uniref:BTB/POZ domain-containing protein 2-like n=1 Tax=Topomyia yanbarensis TaxID=2498891 RepID=UPI00273B1E44|nr:BTB/POZ domain-containing protein 2-like [Topomyia yanbarensis]
MDPKKTTNGDSSDWRYSCVDNKSRLKYMCETGTMSDCEFLVGKGSEGQKVKAHKFVLAMVSPVFDTMFYGALSTKNDEPIRVSDIDLHEFKKLMTYIYMDHLGIASVSEAMNLYYAAKKYMLPRAVAECITYLQSNQVVDSVCQVYEFAKFYDESKLMSICLTIMCDQTSTVITGSGFLDADLSTIITILNQNDLTIDSELDLFKAIKRYAHKHGLSRAIESQQHPEPKKVAVDSQGYKNPHKDQSTILDALHRIRFQIIKPSQLAPELIGTELLTKSEVLEILLCSSMQEGGQQYTVPKGFSSSSEPRIKKKLCQYCKRKLQCNKMYCSYCGHYRY